MRLAENELREERGSFGHRAKIFLCLLAILLPPFCVAETLPVEITWGRHSTNETEFFLKLSGRELQVGSLRLEKAEPADQLKDGVVRSRAGGGDVDGVSFLLEFASRSIQPITNAHQIWRYLLQNGDAGAARRLQADAAWRPDSRKLVIQLNEGGTRGFSLTVDQLATQKIFWFPELDLFISAGETPLSFEAHQRALQSTSGQRVLDRVEREAEASYREYTSRWEDMGSIAYNNPHSVAPGHIVGLTWDSALYKFGVDRRAGVRNDYSKLDVFNFQFALGNQTNAWRGQRLDDGLPIIITTFEKEGILYEIEQFAFPLAGPPSERRGDIEMVLLQRIRLRETEDRARNVSIGMQLTRQLSSSEADLKKEGDGFVLGSGTSTWLALQSPDIGVNLSAEDKKQNLVVTLDLPARSQREFVIKLPSPVVPPKDKAALLALDYYKCRTATANFWNQYLARGAAFKVPDEAVNTLFRANLWHALRLPRRHGGSESGVKIDLPYSNFAYDQKGTPWPVNEAAYVDYMLYDLRGYHAISAEELAVMYRYNQEPNGHVGGFANWGVYTPSMLYATAQHFLLSADRDSFEALLPQTLRALDWCLSELKRARDPGNATPGLVFAPLNDLTHDARAWGFNQAYLLAGFDLLGRALAEIRHSRAAECREAASEMRKAVEREFGRASLRSTAVQLADGTWSAFVPTDAQGSGRMFQTWYPTDVDVGPLHLLRLKALDARGPLANALLNDHEDNLFFKGWGAINEPVYNMQGTAYLLRDEPKAAIRTFYSTMACAFSHSVFEPVEHRWAWGQYFGPPSTDGAWFELYRNMLIRELDDDSLLLCQAAPRAWLEKGKIIDVRGAPTYYGPMAFTMGSLDEHQMTAHVELSKRKLPSALFVRFRHPGGKPIQSVSVNGQNWDDFDAGKEWVRIPKPKETRYTIVAKH